MRGAKECHDVSVAEGCIPSPDYCKGFGSLSSRLSSHAHVKGNAGIRWQSRTIEWWNSKTQMGVVLSVHLRLQERETQEAP